MALLLIPMLVAVVAAGTLRHRRRRWVSPYTRFRTAAARVTRTGETPFRIAGAQIARSAPDQ